MKNNVTNPFPQGTANSNLFRIPAVTVLKDGRILCFADVRYGGGSDDPANIDTICRHSDDGGKTWSDTKFVNHFDDMEDSDSEKAEPTSASFIDSAVCESKDGTVFVACDMCPAFVGLWSAGTYGNGSGFIDGKLALCDKTTHKKAESTTLDKTNYPYYAGEFINGFAPVLKFKDSGNYCGYHLDKSYNLYKKVGETFEPVLINQMKKDGSLSEKKITANIFYAHSPVKVYPTYYLWIKKSTDGGESFSDGKILNFQVNSKGFTGFAPGRALSTMKNGKERIIFAVYDNNDKTEYASVIYTDDGGNTWKRSKKANAVGDLGKSSESQIIEMNNGVLRMFSRNTADFIGYCDSYDGGETWGEYTADKDLKYCSNCQFSVITGEKNENGETAVYISLPQEKTRKRGVLKIGFFGEDNVIKWKYSKLITDSLKPFTFVYSCLAQKENGDIFCLYESDKAKLDVISFTQKETESNDKTALSPIQKLKSRLYNFKK